MYVDFEELCSELKETPVFKKTKASDLARILPSIFYVIFKYKN